MDHEPRIASRSRTSTSRPTSASVCTRRRATCRRSSSGSAACCCRSPPTSRIPSSRKPIRRRRSTRRSSSPGSRASTDGPTSSRFAIVDYNADTGTLEAAGRVERGRSGVRRQRRASRSTQGRVSTFQFHQVSVWALLQCALAFFEDALRARTHDSVGVRGQPADRRAACRLRRERLLRPRQQVAAVLLLRLGRGHRLHLPLGRHRQSRVRPRRPRRHPAAVQREQPPADRRASTSSWAISRPFS